MRTPLREAPMKSSHQWESDMSTVYRKTGILSFNF